MSSITTNRIEASTKESDARVPEAPARRVSRPVACVTELDLGVGGCAASVAGLLIWFKRKRWT